MLFLTAFKEHPDSKYLMNVESANLADAQRTAAYKGSGTLKLNNDLDGRPVVALPGLHEDTIVATYCSNTPSSNLWYPSTAVATRLWFNLTSCKQTPN